MSSRDSEYYEFMRSFHKKLLGNEFSKGDPSFEETPALRRERPSMYKVVILNDDMTPNEFVAHLVQRLFHKTDNEANDLAERINSEGMGECGIFTREIAETKIIQVLETSRQYNYPLRCVMYQAQKADTQ